jgi:myo-inositol 2-dehydrogenase/D-chiro-inositol 1-dehydrogenase
MICQIAQSTPEEIFSFGSCFIPEIGSTGDLDNVVRSTGKGIARPPVDHSFPTRYRDAYRAELECFLDCVRGDREVPITHDQVRRSYVMADSAERSFREGRPVRIGEPC